MTQTIIGGGALVLALNFAVGAILPQPAPIEVHSLAYADGGVIQARTINTEQDAYPLAWTATVERADTGDSIRLCEGSGANGYPPGYREVVFPSLAEWTGRIACNVSALEPGFYRLRATWAWGEGYSVSAKSEPFEVAE